MGRGICSLSPSLKFPAFKGSTNQILSLVEKYSKKHFLSLFDFLKNNRSSDFYITKDNKRFYVSSLEDLKYFIRSTRSIYLIEEKGDCLGVICLWRSVNVNEANNKIERDYVKVNALNEDILRDLLSVLLWQFGEKDLYIKFKANSKFLKVFREKRFHSFRDWEAIQAIKDGKKLDNLDPKREIIFKREKFIPLVKVEINKD